MRVQPECGFQGAWRESTLLTSTGAIVAVDLTQETAAAIQPEAAALVSLGAGALARAAGKITENVLPLPGSLSISRRA